MTTEKTFLNNMDKAAVKGSEYVEKEHQRRMKAVPNPQKVIDDWNNFSKSIKDSAKSKLNGVFSSDFSNYNKASDDIYSSNPTGGSQGEDGRLSLEDLMYFGNFRIGITHRATYGMANDAIRNWFQFADPDSLKPKSLNSGRYKEIYKKMVSTNFRNATPYWGGLARNYGVGFMVKFWGNDKGDMHTAPPKTVPRRFEPISPVFMQPTNTWESRGLSWDEEIWEFTSGQFGGKNAGNSFKIHRDRVEVFRPQPRPDMWRGLSVLDPISMSVNCYYNAFIFITRAFAKFGNMIPVWKAASEFPTPEEVEGRIEVMDAFMQNGFMVTGRNDQIEFPNTRISAGLYEALEIYKEDIASGLSAPLNQLFGRAASGGIGGEGALSAERTYMNTLANFEMSISDDILNIWKQYYPELEDDTLLWNLAIQKTKVQQMQEDSLRIQNETAEQQLEMLKQQNQMGKMQIKLFEENKDAFSTDEKISTADQIKDDFTERKRQYEHSEQQKKYNEILLHLERTKRQLALLSPKEKN